jgi:hypothetical protein
MAEKTTLNLKPGRYFAGINRPWYASQSAVRSEIQKRLGLTDIQFFSRKTSAPPVNPKIDPRYGEGWDEWVAARYGGPPKQVTTDRLWQWVVHASDTVKLPGLPAAPATSSPTVMIFAGTPQVSGGGALVALGLGAFALAVWHARR